MSIRPATMADLAAIVAMGEKLHAESPRWSRLRYSRMRVADMIASLIASPNGLMLVAENDGKVIGGLAAVCGPHWSSDDITAEEVSFFMLPEHRGSFSAGKMICAYRRWAELRGAVWAAAGTSTGVDAERTAGLYEVLGFERCAIGLEVMTNGN